MVPWVHPSPQPKEYLDQVSRFAGLTIVQTDRKNRPTDRQTTLLVCITIGRIYVVRHGLAM